MSENVPSAGLAQAGKAGGSQDNVYRFLAEKQVEQQVVLKAVEMAEDKLMQVVAGDVDAALDLIQQIKLVKKEIDAAVDRGQLKKAGASWRALYDKIGSLADKDRVRALADTLAPESLPALFESTVQILKARGLAQNIQVSFEARKLENGWFLAKVSLGAGRYFIKVHEKDLPQDVAGFIGNAQKGMLAYRESVIAVMFEVRVREILADEGVHLGLAEIQGGKLGFPVIETASGIKLGWLSSELFYFPEELKKAVLPLQAPISLAREQLGRLPGDYLVPRLQFWVSYDTANTVINTEIAQTGTVHSYLKPAFNIDCDCPIECLTDLIGCEIPDPSCVSCIECLEDKGADVPAEPSQPAEPAPSSSSNSGGVDYSLPLDRYYPNRNRLGVGLAASVFEDAGLTFQIFAGGEVGLTLLDTINMNWEAQRFALVVDIDPLLGISRPLPLHKNVSIPLRVMGGGGLSMLFGTVVGAENESNENAWMVTKPGWNVFLDVSLLDILGKIRGEKFTLTMFTRFEHHQFYGEVEDASYSTVSVRPPFWTGEKKTFALGLRFAWDILPFKVKGRALPESSFTVQPPPDADKDKKIEDLQGELAQRKEQKIKIIERTLSRMSGLKLLMNDNKPNVADIENLEKMKQVKPIVIKTSADVDNFVSLARQAGLEEVMPKATMALLAGSVAMQLIDILEKNPGENIIISGYTDSRGSVKHNKELSVRRALLVKMILVKFFGAPEGRLEEEGKGEAENEQAAREKLFGPDYLPAAQENNRRVEFTRKETK